MAQLKAFKVEGNFKMGDHPSHFAIETAAADANGAREKVVSTLGSKHRVNRTQVRIDGVKEIPASEVTDAVVAHLLKQGA